MTTREVTSNNEYSWDENTPQEESIFWRGIKVTCNFFYETPSMVYGILLVGIVAHIFFPSLALPCYAIAGFSLLSKFVIEITAYFNLQLFNDFEEWAWNLKLEYPYLQTVLIVCTIASGLFWSMLSVILAVPVGVFNAVIFEIELCKKLQQVHHQKVLDSRSRYEVRNILNV